MPSASFPTWFDVLFVVIGILSCLIGWYLLALSRERIWIQIQRRNAELGVGSPPTLPEQAVRSYRIRGAMLLIMGVAFILITLAASVWAQLR